VAALDGLRGVAIALVVLFHLATPLGRGGYLGVDIFFVLSGFLIGTLLLNELVASGRVDIGRFFAHRVRRLVPSLLITLWGVIITVIVLGHLAPTVTYVPLATLRTAVVATVLYVGNWFGHERITPLGHTWSLGIEEQFYIVAPFALWLLAKRVRDQSVFVGGIVVAGGISMALLARDNPALAYFSTFGRLGELGLGLGLALILQRRPQWVARTTVQWLGVASVFILLGLAQIPQVGTVIRWPSRWMFFVGMPLAGVATTALIALLVSAPHHLVTRVMAVRPLVWLGGISYALYLVHWPVVYFLTTSSTQWSPVIVDTVRVALSVGLAAALTHWVETPLRRRPLSRSMLLFLSSVMVITIVLAPVLLRPSVAAPFAAPQRTTQIQLVNGRVPGSPGVVGRPFQWTYDLSVAQIRMVGDAWAAQLVGPIRAAWGASLVSVADSSWGLATNAGRTLSAASVTASLNLTMLGVHQQRAELVVLALGSSDRSALQRHPQRVWHALRELVTAILGQPQGTNVLLVDPAPLGNGRDQSAHRLASWNHRLAHEFPGRVRAVPYALLQAGRVATFLPPGNMPGAPHRQWVRVRGVDGRTVCATGVVREAASIMSAVPQLNPLHVRWYAQRWVRPVYAHTAGICLSDHP
jgi:peptidoglycan/LPS O-acetylase OafA/YrhL